MPEQISAIVPGRDPDRLIKWFIGLVLLGVAALLGGVALLYRPELRVGWLGGRAKRADLPLTADGNERDYRIRVDSLRKTAFVAGLIYLVTFVSIPILLLCGPVRNDQGRRRGLLP